MIRTAAPTPEQCQALADRTGQPWYFANGTPFCEEDMIAWYRGVLPKGVTIFRPSRTEDEPATRPDVP